MLNEVKKFVQKAADEALTDIILSNDLRLGFYDKHEAKRVIVKAIEESIKEYENTVCRGS